MAKSQSGGGAERVKGGGMRNNVQNNTEEDMYTPTLVAALSANRQKQPT